MERQRRAGESEIEEEREREEVPEEQQRMEREEVPEEQQRRRLEEQTERMQQYHRFFFIFMAIVAFVLFLVFLLRSPKKFPEFLERLYRTGTFVFDDAHQDCICPGTSPAPAPSPSPSSRVDEPFGPWDKVSAFVVVVCATALLLLIFMCNAGFCSLCPERRLIPNIVKAVSVTHTPIICLLASDVVKQDSNIMIAFTCYAYSFLFGMMAFQVHEDFGVIDCIIAIALGFFVNFKGKTTMWLLPLGAVLAKAFLPDYYKLLRKLVEFRDDWRAWRQQPRLIAGFIPPIRSAPSRQEELEMAPLV